MRTLPCRQGARLPEDFRHLALAGLADQQARRFRSHPTPHARPFPQPPEGTLDGLWDDIHL